MKTRDVTLKSGGIDIDARLYIPDGSGSGPVRTVCISHGIPSGQPNDPGDRGYPGLAEDICALGFAVFIFNSRGTGRSGGNLDMAGWKADLHTVVDWLLAAPEVDKDRLTLMGFSAGAAVSVCVAAEDSRVASVLACACPTEMKYEDPDAVIEHFRNIGAIRDGAFPASEAEWHKGFGQVVPLKVVHELAPRPLFLLHGVEDEVVPVRQAYQLYEKAGQPKQLILVDGTGHRIRHYPRAIHIALDWLKHLP